MFFGRPDADRAGRLVIKTASRTSAPPASCRPVKTSPSKNQALNTVTTGIPLIKTDAWEAGILERA